jgi:hypothetical protein
MQGWKIRLGLVLTMMGMLLAVSVPAAADEFDDLAFEAEVEDCELVSTGNDDGDWFEDEDEPDGHDDDGDGWEGEDGLVLVCEVEFDDDAFEDLSFDEFDDDDDDDDDDDEDEDWDKRWDEHWD